LNDNTRPGQILEAFFHPRFSCWWVGYEEYAIANVCLHIKEKLVKKKQIKKHAILVYLLGKLMLLALNKKFLHKNDI